MFLKIVNAWVNLDTITRVQIVLNRAEPQRLQVYLSDRQAPVDVTDSQDVELLLDYCERHNVESVPPAPSAPYVPEKQTEQKTEQKPLRTERQKVPEKQMAKV